MYAIISNGSIVRMNPTKIKIGSVTIYNPTLEQLLETGDAWVELKYVDPPTDAPEGKHYESSWGNDGTQLWTLVDDVDEGEEISAEEALNIIMGVVRA